MVQPFSTYRYFLTPLQADDFQKHCGKRSNSCESLTISPFATICLHHFKNNTFIYRFFLYLPNVSKSSAADLQYMGKDKARLDLFGVDVVVITLVF